MVMPELANQGEVVQDTIINLSLKMFVKDASKKQLLDNYD